MACPYFFPIARLDNRAWAVPPRLPLGDPYSGECRAQVEPIAPSQSTLRELCNCGYGRGRCERFPPDGADDAVRFHVLIERASSLRIQYVFERECWPVRHGILEYTGIVEDTPDAILARQAAAFAESYLSRAALSACP